MGYKPINGEKVTLEMNINFQHIIPNNEKRHYEVEFAKNNKGDVLVDVNPKDRDGYEYKVVGKENLFVWSNNKWTQADCFNIIGVKDTEGKNERDFYDAAFKDSMIAIIGYDGMPDICKENENRHGCAKQLTGSILGNISAGVFLEAYNKACAPELF